MGVRILGVGLGLFILLLLWTVALLVCLILWKSKGPASYAGFGLLTLAFIVTVILVAIPKSSDTPTPVETKIYDYNFIGRVALVVVMSLFAILSLVFMLAMHCSQPVFAKRLLQIGK